MSTRRKRSTTQDRYHENLNRRLTSVAGAAEYADCGINTIRRRISDGTLKAYRFGPKVIRVDLDDVDKLLRPIPAGSSAA